MHGNKGGIIMITIDQKIVQIIQDALKGMDNEYLDDEDIKDEDYVS